MYAILLVVVMASFIIGDLIAIPFSYVFSKMDTTDIGLGKRLAKHLSGDSTKPESPAAVPAAQEEEVSPA